MLPDGVENGGSDHGSDGGWSNQYPHPYGEFQAKENSKATRAFYAGGPVLTW